MEKGRSRGLKREGKEGVKQLGLTLSMDNRYNIINDVYENLGSYARLSIS